MLLQHLSVKKGNEQSKLEINQNLSSSEVTLSQRRPRIPQSKVDSNFFARFEEFRTETQIVAATQFVQRFTTFSILAMIHQLSSGYIVKDLNNFLERTAR